MTVEIVPCLECTGKYGVEPPKLVVSDGGWRVSCSGCGCRSPAFLDRDFAVRSWNRGVRKARRGGPAG